MSSTTSFKNVINITFMQIFYWKPLFDRYFISLLTNNFYKNYEKRPFLYEKKKSPGSDEIYSMPTDRRKFTCECSHFKKTQLLNRGAQNYRH